MDTPLVQATVFSRGTTSITLHRFPALSIPPILVSIKQPGWKSTNVSLIMSVLTQNPSDFSLCQNKSRALRRSSMIWSQLPPCLHLQPLPLLRSLWSSNTGFLLSLSTTSLLYIWALYLLLPLPGSLSPHRHLACSLISIISAQWSLCQRGHS